MSKKKCTFAVERDRLADLFSAVAEIVTAPLALVAWPVMIAVFLYNEEEP